MKINVSSSEASEMMSQSLSSKQVLTCVNKTPFCILDKNTHGKPYNVIQQNNFLATCFAIFICYLTGQQ